MTRHFLNILVAVHWRNAWDVSRAWSVWRSALVGTLHTDTNCVVIQVVQNLDRFTHHSQFLSEGSSRAADSDSATKWSLIFYCTRRLVFTYALPSGLYSDPNQVRWIFTTYFSMIHFNINHTVQLPYHSVILNSFCPTIAHIYVSYKHRITLHLMVLFHNRSSSTRFLKFCLFNIRL